MNQKNKSQLADPSSAESDARFTELDRVIDSEVFKKSPRLAALLKYICDRSWTGRTDELSEQQIGIGFFYRSPGFNAAEDAIVRGSARQLRKRLQLYYDGEGKSSTHRIDIAKGGYVARIEVIEDVSDAKGKTSWFSRPVVFSGSGLLLLLIALVLLYTLTKHQDRVVQNDMGMRLLWSALFQPKKRTVIVPGDAALNLYTAYTHRPVSLHEYTEETYKRDSEIAKISPEGPGPIPTINITTMADLKLISELVRIPYREKLDVPEANVEVRYARDLSAADLRGANLVLLGADTFDPWVSLFDSKLDFALERGFEHYTFRVVNRSPKPGEPVELVRQPNQALTILALTESPSGDEHSLIVEGTTMGSVYAAYYFLFTPKLRREVIDSAVKGGKLHDFEVLLQSDFIKDEVSNTKVVAWHVH